MAAPRSAAVVGGGVIGLALARELSALGVETTVLDRGAPGGEASGAAAGLLAPQSEGLPPGPLFDLALASRNLYPEWTDQLGRETGIDTGFRKTGVLRFETSGEDGGMPRRFAWQTRAGLPIEEADARRIESLSAGLAAARFDRALFFPEDGLVDPPALIRALALSAERLGVRILSGRTARRFALRRGICVGVEIGQGAGEEILEADCVIDAAGAWASFDPPTVDLPIEPVRGQIVELRPLALPPTVLWSEDVYLVPRSDGRLLLGSTEERVGFVREVTAGAVAHLIGAARRLAPDLSSAAFSRAWAGLRPGSADGIPILGASRVPGLWLAAGHYRNGILLAPVTARLIARAISGEDLPTLRPFSLERFGSSRGDPASRKGRGDAIFI